jgi:hypothetical protein
VESLAVEHRQEEGILSFLARPQDKNSKHKKIKAVDSLP